MTAANAARSFSVLTLIAFVVSAFTSCVDDRNVSLATGGSAGKLGSAGDASASGGTAGATGSGGSAGGGGSGNNDSSVSGGAAGNDSGIQDSGAEAGVELEQFCGLLLSEVCTWIKGCKLFARCEDWPNYPRIQTTCLAAPTAVAAGRLRYDPLEAKACLDAVSKPTVPDGGPCQRAGGPVVVTSLNFGQGPCARAFTGLVPPGGDCFTESSLGGSECAGGVCYRTAACPGRCVAYRRAAQSCGAPGEYCDPETFCNVNVCETRRAAGAQCDDEKQCQTGMICIPASDGGPLKRCVVLGGEGDACQVSASCGARECHEGRCRAKVPTGSACRSDFVCPENEVCVMGSPLARVGVCGSGLALGTACGKSTDCRGHQPIDPQGPTCKSTNGIEAPVCTAPAALNQPCGSRPCNPGPCDYLGCEAGTYCDSYSGGASICRSFSQSGGSCTTHAQCAAGLICMSGTTCRAPGALGENCSPENYAPSSCQDGLHCDWVARKCALPRTGLAQGCTPRWSNSCQADMYCACEEPTCNSINWNTPSPTMCEHKLPDGQPCQMPFQCIGGYCNSGKCARYPRFNYCDGIDDGPDAGAEAG